jgi:2-amino-4-hydroxy-6-hydroxymethyldihydropteridine diphosphokinase
MTVCYLALGSNIDPMNNLRQAIHRLADLSQFQVSAISPWYETEPWGMTEQAAFVNLVLQGQWWGDVVSLLDAALAIEASLDRVRRVKNGPRTIDIDILLFGNEQCQSELLTVPHPGLYERDFMLVPLLDIAPDAIDPVSSQLLNSFREKLMYRCIRHPVQLCRDATDSQSSLSIQNDSCF